MTALKALREFYNRIGDEFVILLPETIPFLAEVLEGVCVAEAAHRGQRPRALTPPCIVL